MESKVIEVHKVNEGVEVVFEEERGITKRTFVHSLVIGDEAFGKIKNIMLTDERIRSKNKKNKTWELFYPDGTSSLMNYDPTKKAEEESAGVKKKIERIKELHQLTVNGLVNGLSHTHQDGRLDDIDFWVKRCKLFDSFSHCVLDIITDQNAEYSEKDLKEISKEGYHGKED